MSSGANQLKASVCILLKATNWNWGLKGPGYWDETKWIIYSDGTYEAETSFFLDDNIRKSEGILAPDQFAKLQKLLSEDWFDPGIDSYACDGDAWQFKLLYPSGRTKKSSGKPRYIYGQPIERIVPLLPRED